MARTARQRHKPLPRMAAAAGAIAHRVAPGGAGAIDHSPRVASQRQWIDAAFGHAAQRREPGAPATSGPVAQRGLFNHGRETLLTTDHKIQGGDDSDGLHEILAAMCSAGTLDDINSLEAALNEDLESDDDETAEWVEHNKVGIALLLQQITSVRAALSNKAAESDEDGSEASGEDDGKPQGGGQTVGKITFAGNEYHESVKPKVIAAIGKKKLSVLVYGDKKHHNFNFWFEKDGSIYADQNSNRNSKGKYTGYKRNGRDAVEDT